MNYKNYTQKAFEIAKAHGFHDKELPLEHYLMLILTEISELVEADRKSKYADIDAMQESLIADVDDAHWKSEFERYIKDTDYDEMADIAIRIFDLACAFGWELTEAHQCDGLKSPTDFNSFTEEAYQLCKYITNTKDVKGLNLALTYLESMAEWRDCDLEWHIEQKMKYNNLRAYKHGKKY